MIQNPLCSASTHPNFITFPTTQSTQFVHQSMTHARTRGIQEEEEEEEDEETDREQC
jgi:hypothetical protein